MPEPSLNSVTVVYPDNIKDGPSGPAEEQVPANPTGPTCPTGATGCIVLSKEDRLEAENIQLRLIVASRAKRDYYEEAKACLEAHDRELNSIQEELNQMQRRLWDKYGIDWKTQAIEPKTGRVIDAVKSGVNPIIYYK